MNLRSWMILGFAAAIFSWFDLPAFATQAAGDASDAQKAPEKKAEKVEKSNKSEVAEAAKKSEPGEPSKEAPRSPASSQEILSGEAVEFLKDAGKKVENIFDPVTRK